ncbi:fungal-specific transcription factor domain-containing protein [Halteromyces radiatus]|uniref:fungal-specific transcription factor domain-containing protein n=1 Tax=Halteromyces radiatus TaxID=101107 RepID=UPI0022210B86|nr:fungal-specific transcription factor domain-containing protein [Halteromyces radiatus]KAI8093360.1 fungal-specific transcription factor domain-containing protein [Halteromyces radiatus]
MTEEGERKRQRVSRACEQCRRKKIKCLGSPPTCNNCITLGIQCHYLESTKKRGPPKGYIEAIEGRLQRLEALLGSFTQEDDPRSQAILAELNTPLETAYGELVRPRPLHHTSLQDLDGVPNSMMHMKSETLSDQDSNSSNYNQIRSDHMEKNNTEKYHTEGNEQRSPQQRPDQLDNLSIDDSGQLRYYGKSSGFDMLHSNKNLKNGSIHFNSNDLKSAREGKIAVDPYELPPDDLSQHLLDLYFNTFYPWLPLLHKDSFFERLNSKDNPPPALLLNAIYAITSRLSSDSRVRSDPDRPDTAGDIFFERARLLMDLEWDGFKVYTIQSLLLMSSHQNGALKTSRGWLYSGMAFRMAQNLGLHRNCDNWNLTDVEKEERKRCFYSCFVVDRLSCAMHGRSPVLDERDYDTPYPQYIDKDANGESLQITERFHQLVKLCELLGDVLRDLYMVRGRKQLSMMTCPDSVVSNLDRGLNKWMARLPSTMQYKPPNTRLAERKPAPALQLCQMHMLFYTTLILLHRPFIPDSSTTAAPSVFPSASICTFAANKILDISESLLADGVLKGVNNYALYFMFTAGIIFIHNAQSSDSMFAFEAKISTNKTMRAMDELEKTWSTSARHCNILGALAGLRDINLENVDESYSQTQKLVKNEISIAVPNSPEPEQHPVESFSSSIEQFKDDTSTQQEMNSTFKEELFAETGHIISPLSTPNPSGRSATTIRLNHFDNDDTIDVSQRVFDPNATAFWEIPSSFDIQEWNSYLTDQAQKMDPMMMPPIIQPQDPS